MRDKLDQVVIELKKVLTIDILKYDDSFIKKIIHNRIVESGCKSVNDYGSFLEQNIEEQGVFKNSLHNNYSTFFRNPYTFSVLENVIFPKLIQNIQRAEGRELRIWSLACASGQEAYSLAILLEELGNSGSRKFNYRIFGTDKCELQLKKATKGAYSENALDNLTLKRVKYWFTNNNDTYTVKPSLKEHVHFSVFDLFNKQLNSPSESVFGNFDIIFCANLFFYYTKEYQEKILKKIKYNLAKGGYVVTGENERGILLKSNYKEVFPQTGIFKRSIKLK